MMFLQGLFLCPMRCVTEAFVQEAAKNALSFEEREAPTYNEAAVLRAKAEKTNTPLPCGCSKLDEGDYTEKLTSIISNNNIKV